MKTRGYLARVMRGTSFDRLDDYKHSFVVFVLVRSTPNMCNVVLLPSGRSTKTSWDWLSFLEEIDGAIEWL